MNLPAPKVLWLPLSVTLQYCHAWQARQGSNMRWVYADDVSVESDMQKIKALVRT